MMEFFVPSTKSTEQADNVYTAIKEHVKDSLKWNIQNDRIYSIKYRHNGREYIATVGDVETFTHDLVLAILKSNTYLVCTINRGGLRGEPILVGYEEALNITYFDK
jgi:hypothetical protein